jgi:hypothetical protein
MRIFASLTGIIQSILINFHATLVLVYRGMRVEKTRMLTLPCQLSSMDDSSYRLNFDLGKKNEIHHRNWKEHLKISKIAKFGCEIYSPAKFANFVLFCIAHGKVHHFQTICGAYSLAEYKLIQNFTTILYNFKTLYLAVVMDFVLSS